MKTFLSLAIIIISTLAIATENYIVDKWDDISTLACDITTMRDENKDLPFLSLFGASRHSNNKKIEKLVKKGRGILLSTTATKLLATVDELDEEIQEETQELEKLKSELILHPKKAEKLQKKINRQNEVITKLNASRKDAMAKAAQEIRKQGLNVDDKTIEVFLTNISANTLIDNAIVAQNVKCAVEKLEALITNADITSAKRYFGMYLVLVDIHLECLASYEEEYNDEWLPGIERIIKEAQKTQKQAQKNLKNPNYTESEKSIFQSNIKTCETVIAAANSYKSMLQAQYTTILQKKSATEKIRSLAENSYETTRIAGELAELIKSGKTTFDAIMQMELPELKSYENPELIEEFKAISLKIKEGK